jgi:hypothetical protein
VTEGVTQFRSSGAFMGRLAMYFAVEGDLSPVSEINGLDKPELAFGFD